MARRALVTGGAGFIGSHLAAALLARGDSVRIADNLSTGYRHNLDVNPGVEFMEGDLADAAFAARAVDGIDLVLHQAAIPSVPRSVKDPVTSHRANIDATLNVLTAARAAGVRRVVYAGSSSAYGDTPVLPKREDMPPNPRSPYALQKLVGEQYCQLFTRLYGLEAVTIRYFNVFGPRQDPTSAYSGVISQFASALTEGRRPTIYGASGEVINVATGGRISLLELFETMKKVTGADVEPLFAEARAGDVRDSQADISKARRLLGYEPRVSFADGLSKTIEWYRTSPVTQL
jgi:nucleoside-diphosphate-sugar epimerase